MDNYDYSGRSSGLPKPFKAYASGEITVSGIQADYSLKDNSTLFDTVVSPVEILIRNGSSAVTVKFNDSANDSIPISGDDAFGVQNLIVTDILVTTTVSGLTSLSVYTQGWR
jgi:hypothetical protein